MVKYTNRDILPLEEVDAPAAREPRSSTLAALSSADPDQASQRMQPKVLRATITVELEAHDYIEAADHQKRLQADLVRIQQDYPGAWLTLGGRHQRGDSQAGRRPRLLRQSGRLNEYE